MQTQVSLFTWTQILHPWALHLKVTRMWASNVVLLKQGCGGDVQFKPLDLVPCSMRGPRMPSFKPGLHKFVCWGPACPIISGAPWRPPLYPLALFNLDMLFEGLVWWDFCASSFNFGLHKKSHQSKLRYPHSGGGRHQWNFFRHFHTQKKNPCSSGTLLSGLHWLAPACFLWNGLPRQTSRVCFHRRKYQSLSIIWCTESLLGW